MKNVKSVLITILIVFIISLLTYGVIIENKIIIIAILLFIALMVAIAIYTEVKSRL